MSFTLGGGGIEDEGMNGGVICDRRLIIWIAITVVLKETATLKRIAKEKEAKRLRKPVKEVLPQRPINGQRQYYLW